MSEPQPRETDSFAVFPDPPPTELARFLDIGGYKWVASDSAIDIVERRPAEPEPPSWAGALVVVDERSDEAWRFCRELRKRDVPLEPTLVLISGSRIDELQTRDDLFDDEPGLVHRLGQGTGHRAPRRDEHDDQ